MKVVKYICDKCGYELLEGEQMSMLGFDVCEGCYDEGYGMIESWIRGKKKRKAAKDEIGTEIDVDKFTKPLEVVQVASETAQEPQEAPKKKDIDWNKACALKLAGWSHKNIAGEMGINEGTLNSGTFYKKLEQYKSGVRF